MKKIIIAIIAVGALLTSCNNNGKKAATKNAEKVNLVKNDNTQTYTTVKSTSNIDWSASHLGGLQKRFGKIYVKDANFLVNNNKLTNATVNIDMASLTVNSFPEGAAEIKKLEGHLKSADFFNIEKHSNSKFELTSLQTTTGKYNAKLTGNLTIIGVTKSIVFNANVTITDNEVSIQSENFSIDRTDWGLSYHTEGSAGVPVDYLIANTIGFTINVTIAK